MYKRNCACWQITSFYCCLRSTAQTAQRKISTVSKNTNQSAKPLWLVFSLSNLWIIVSSFVTLPSSQNQPLSAVVKGCQYILLAHLLHIACSFTAGSRAAHHLQHAPRRFYHGGTFYRADRHAGRAAVRRRPQQSRPQRIPVGVQPFGAADQKPVGLYRMKQGRHKIYRMSFLNNDVKTANL